MATPADHPAPFSDSIVFKLHRLTKTWDGPILDPYAGIGRIANLARDDTFGIEIEPEFDAASLLPEERRICGDSRFLGQYIADGRLPRPNALVFSPDYGNRMADQYLGTPAERDLRERTGTKPRRRSYAISLNRRVSEGSGAAHQWGPDYRRCHEAVMESVSLELPVGAKIACNISDHFRGNERQPVTAWWVGMLGRCGWRITEMVPVKTPRFQDGQNRELRVENEWVLIGLMTQREEP